MRDPARIDVYIEELRRAWKANPDLRLGQLIDNAHGLATGYRDALAPDLFNIEDDELVKGIVNNAATAQRITISSTDRWPTRHEAAGGPHGTQFD